MKQLVLTILSIVFLFSCNSVKRSEGNMDESGIEIIINVDDTGNHPDTIRAARELWSQGRVSSVSVMAYGPDFENTINELMETDIPVGIHLGVHHGRPISDPSEIPSICDELGNFYNDLETPTSLYAIEEVEKEMVAQIEKVLETGVRVSHLDSHFGFLYYEENLRALLADLAQRYSLSVSLPGHEVFDPFREQFSDRNTTASDDLYMFYELETGMDPMESRIQQYEELFKTMTPGLYYIASHPMYPSDEVQATWGDSPIRFADYAFFSSQEWNDLLEKYNISLVSFPN